MIFGLILFWRWLFKSNSVFVVSLCIVFSLLGLKMFSYFTIWGMGFGVFLLFHRLKYKLPSGYMLLLIAALACANHFLVYKNIFLLPEFAQYLTIAVIVCLVLLCESGKKQPNKYLKCLNYFMAEFSDAGLPRGISTRDAASCRDTRSPLRGERRAEVFQSKELPALRQDSRTSSHPDILP